MTTGNMPDVIFPIVLAVFLSALLGSIVGFVCRGRVGLQLVTCTVLESIIFFYIQFMAGTLSFKVSLLENILGGLANLIAPFVLFFLLPAMLASMVVGHWRKRKLNYATALHNDSSAVGSRKFVPILSLCYAVYAFFSLCFASFFMFRAYGVMTAASTEEALPPMAWLFFDGVIILTLASIVLAGLLAYLLAVKRARKPTLILAAVSMLNMPVGTILGILSIYAITRPEIASEFKS